MTFQLGLDVLLDQQKNLVAGRRIGLITCPSSIDHALIGSYDRFLQHPDLTVVALFGPEHGVRGMAQAGDKVSTASDPVTGIPEYSLYGETRKPTAAMLVGLDVLVYDLQDAGVRYFTYASTLVSVMQAAAEQGIPLIVLDRPNPLGGETVEGPLLDMAFTSFVGIAPLPVRHGLTIGELACFCNDALDIHCEMTVVRMAGWQRNLWYDDTRLPFVPLSPNMPTLDTATLYPGTCLIEGTSLSEGRGTTRPFEYLGAPWLDSSRLAHDLNALDLPGVRFRPVSFQPYISKHQGQPCHGVHVYVSDRASFRAFDSGLHILEAVRNAAPEHFTWVAPFAEEGAHFIDLLAGSDTLRNHMDAGRPVSELIAQWAPEASAFAITRQPYLLYN